MLHPLNEILTLYVSIFYIDTSAHLQNVRMQVQFRNLLSSEDTLSLWVWSPVLVMYEVNAVLILKMQIPATASLISVNLNY
jgi:hypothetical protein